MAWRYSTAKSTEKYSKASTARMVSSSTIATLSTLDDPTTHIDELLMSEICSIGERDAYV